MQSRASPANKDLNLAPIPENEIINFSDPMPPGSLKVNPKSVWLSLRNPDPGAKVRLFCFPYAGGGEAAYRTWQQNTPCPLAVIPVQLPGRGSRLAEPPFTRLRPLVLALSEALASEMDGRFAFFGHSMGGLIAFELARQLRREGKPLPVHLFISAKCCPTNTEELPSSELSDTQLIDILRSYEGTPEEVLQDPELMSLLLPAIRADMELCKTYVCEAEPPLPCRITVFGGLEDHVSRRPGLEAWREYTSAPFALRMFPAGHFFIKKWERSVLEVICRDLF